MTQARVRVAVQKSGRLTDNSIDLLVRCGLKLSRSRQRLICYGENMPVDVLLVRDDDIPELVHDHVCDLGIVGLNIVEEYRLGLQDDVDCMSTAPRLLDFGYCRLAIAGPEETHYEGTAGLHGRRIATSYPRVLRRFLDDHGIDAGVVTLSGAVEIAPRLGKADFICDLVSTGRTLAANHLREVETVLETRAALIIAEPSTDPVKQAWVERLLMRIDGVQQVRESKYIMLHAPRSALPTIKALLPGSETPTVMPLEGADNRVAVHAVCRETVFWETLERLKNAGATAVLVLPVEKMLG